MGGRSSAGMSDTDCKPAYAIVSPNSLLAPEMLGNWMDRQWALTSLLVLNAFKLGFHACFIV